MLALGAALAGLAARASDGARAGPLPVPFVGVADDAPKYADDGGDSIYATLRSLGMREVRMVVDFDPAHPRTIQEQGFLDRSVADAVAHGIGVVFSVWPHAPRAFATDTSERIASFASYLALLARSYPEVKRFIVLNEPNEGYFFAPQYQGRRNVSAAVAFRVLAAAYDRLKAVDPGITVIGLGLSPDGNGVTSTPPVRFLQALGRAYRASGRERPIMDELAFHVHPRDSRTFDERTRFAWPNVGPADLGRLKQAVWDAFHGTAQPTFAEGSAVAGSASSQAEPQPHPLRLFLAELAIQVAIPPSLASSYTNTENVPVATEDWQASAYASMLAAFACDPSVSDILLFLLIDQQDLRRYQSGLERIDGSKRPAFASVRAAIARLAACGVRRTWQHTERVVGARARFDAQRRFWVRQSVFGLSVTAGEDATAKAGLFRVSSARGSGSFAPALDRPPASGGPVLSVVGRVRARFVPRLEVHGHLARGRYRFVVRLRAAIDPARTSVVVGPVFRVG